MSIDQIRKGISISCLSMGIAFSGNLPPILAIQAKAPSCSSESLSANPSSLQWVGTSISVSGTAPYHIGIRAIRFKEDRGSIFETGITSETEKCNSKSSSVENHTLAIESTGPRDHNRDYPAGQSISINRISGSQNPTMGQESPPHTPIPASHPAPSQKPGRQNSPGGSQGRERKTVSPSKVNICNPSCGIEHSNWVEFRLLNNSYLDNSLSLKTPYLYALPLALLSKPGMAYYDRDYVVIQMGLSHTLIQVITLDGRFAAVVSVLRDPNAWRLSYKTP